MAHTQAQYLDKIIDVLFLKNDAALSRTLDVVPPVISKMRNDKLRFGATTACRVSKVTGWTIAQIEADLGVTF